tara:strand:- start:638 stop:1009 length:372 start_codon:yes stop_codon:yes gene_type:complete
MKYNFNYEHWPLLVLQMSEDMDDKKEFEQFIGNFLKIFEKNEKFKLLIDIQNLGSVPIKYLLQMGAFLIKIKPLNKQYLIGSSYICSKKSKRLLDFVFTLHKPVAPHKTAESYEESLKFLVSL